jgi:hypothetical protein
VFIFQVVAVSVTERSSFVRVIMNRLAAAGISTPPLFLLGDDRAGEKE